MRSNPVGRIVRNLLEADRKKAAYKEWVDNLFEPVGLDLFGYARPPVGKMPARNPATRHLPLATQQKPFVRLTNDLPHKEI